jgi:hypothetical protein
MAISFLLFQKLMSPYKNGSFLYITCFGKNSSLMTISTVKLKRRKHYDMVTAEGTGPVMEQILGNKVSYTVCAEAVQLRLPCEFVNHS